MSVLLQRCIQAGLAVLVMVGLAVPTAEANGRFPTANYLVVGPAGRSDTLLLRTTFGLVVSRDAGRSWRWICESAYGSPGSYDVPSALAGDGTAVLGTLSGVLTSRSLCAWDVPMGDPHTAISDLTWDTSGAHLVAATFPFGAPNGVALSDDDGRSWRTGWQMANFDVETVDVAPGLPTRIYMTGYLGGPNAVLYRSDDGGMGFREMTRDFGGGVDAYLAGVDPTDPDVLYVRSNMGVGTLLLKSTDGGAHFARVAQTRAMMRGFALSDDGATVWAGSADRAEGILRSVRGGPFTRVGADVTVMCLRYHAGVLYICGDDATDGFALGCSTDGGDHIAAVMSLRDVAGPLDCPAGTPEADRCGPMWAAQAMMLRFDAAPERPHSFHDIGDGPGADLTATDSWTDAVLDLAGDVPGDVPGEATDARSVGDAADAAPSADLPAPADAASAPRPVSPSHCGCRVGGAGGDLRRVGAVGMLGLALRLRRRGASRRSSSPRRG